MPSGTKFWRMKVRQANGKESRLTFGSYPEITLAGARAERNVNHPGFEGGSNI
jgi:hypothetical protein